MDRGGLTGRKSGADPAGTADQDSADQDSADQDSAVQSGAGHDSDFESFVSLAEPRLRRAYLGVVGVDRMPDAVAEALAFAWENWAQVSAMGNPVGYVFRVGQSRTRAPKRPRLFRVEPSHIPDIEPGLHDALVGLPQKQRTAVWLAHGCGWSHAEVAEVLDVSTSTVSTHVNRGLLRLRTTMGVSPND